MCSTPCRSWQNSDSDDAERNSRTGAGPTSPPGSPAGRSPARRGLRRRGAPAARRRRCEVMQRCGTDVAAQGGRHRRRRRALERRLLPPLPVEGRARRRDPRGRRRAAARATWPTRWPRSRRRRARSGAGSRACWPRPPTARSPRRPSPCSGTAAASPTASRSGHSAMNPRVGRPARRPVRRAGQRRPRRDADLCTHAVVGMLSDHLWRRARPTTPRSTTSSTSASVPSCDRNRRDGPAEAAGQVDRSVQRWLPSARCVRPCRRLRSRGSQ